MGDNVAGKFFSCKMLNSKVATSKETGRRIRNDRAFELTEEQRLEIRNAFEIFDADNNGLINGKELQVCVNAMGFDMSKADASEYISEKGNENGLLNFRAFQDLLAEKMKDRNTLDEIKKIFRLFKEGNESVPNITIDDLRRIARDMDSGLTSADLRSMIDEFDADGDGEISMSEFISIMDPSNTL